MAYGRQYPRSTADFDDLADTIERFVVPGCAPDQPVIHEGDVVATMGSCFALNIGRSLQQHGLEVVVNRIHEDANSPIANRLMLEYMLDPSHNAHRELFEDHVAPEAADELIEPLHRARCLVFTVGVAISCFDQPGDRLVLSPYGTREPTFEWRFATPPDAANDLRLIIEMLRGFNPDLHIVLTLSPVPLYRGVLAESPFVDDCISKSTLRVAIAELMRDGIDGVYYWPSFEIVRWMAGHTGPTFGADDDLPRHVSSGIVNLITSAFVRHFTSLPPASAASPKVDGASQNAPEPTVGALTRFPSVTAASD